MRCQSARHQPRDSVFLPDHSKTLPELSSPALMEIVRTRKRRPPELAKLIRGCRS
ncbi:hypothetical protein KCP75_02890 [Salmonella enterica subsp. enterica]|nr:hypothetical protein KCP75_02890 [Salmonella enterica subsp. enterica]